MSSTLSLSDAISESPKNRFVLLRHEMPASALRSAHWDLMLENKGILLTWEFPELPLTRLPADFAGLGVRRLANHRLLYLDYEGEISGDRGSVRREDAGRFTVEDDHQSCENTVCVRLSGMRFLIELKLPTATFAADQSQSCEGEVRRFERL